MSHPKYLRVRNFKGTWLEISDLSTSPATHEVVPLSAVVIERDENGEWPTWALGALWDYLAEHPEYPLVVGLLDALALAAGEADTP